MQISFAYVFCFVTCKSVVSSSPDLGAYANPKIGMSKVMVVDAYSVIILPPDLWLVAVAMGAVVGHGDCDGRQKHEEKWNLLKKRRPGADVSSESSISATPSKRGIFFY